MNPEIPVHRDPQEALADADECGRLRDRVRREVVELHAVVVAEGPHEAAHRRHEAALMESDEADHVAARRVGRSLPFRRHDPLGRLSVLVRRELAAGHQLVQASRVTVERSHANGSTMMRGCWGAMRADEEVKNKEREEL
jgi:hypothetical protein